MNLYSEQSAAFIQNFGAPQILLILFIVLLLFGAKKLPELARGMGKALKEFKRATSDIEEDLRSAMNEEPKEESIDYKRRSTQKPVQQEEAKNSEKSEVRKDDVDQAEKKEPIGNSSSSA